MRPTRSRLGAVGVLAIWRYPVKAMLGELLRSVQVTAAGLEGDRRWVVADRRTGEPIASKRGPTDARLRACRARLDGEGRLAITLPDGTLATGTGDAGDALSELLERHVELRDAERRHHDFAPVHLMTTRSLAHMRAVAPESDWDPRRFRPNLLLDDGEAGGLSEPSMVGAELHRGGLRLTVELPTPRCVVPTRASEELPRDPSLLRRIVRESRWDLGPVGRQPCLGAYAFVTTSGSLTAGDRLAVTPRAAATPGAAVADALRRRLG